MTGEVCVALVFMYFAPPDASSQITLRGRITPVGGIKEKVTQMSRLWCMCVLMATTVRFLVLTVQESRQFSYLGVTRRMWSMT
jgi:hypothetical protein